MQIMPPWPLESKLKNAISLWQNFELKEKSFSRADIECHFSLIFRYFVKLKQGKYFFHIKNDLTLTRRGYPYNELIGHLNG